MEIDVNNMNIRAVTGDDLTGEEVTEFTFQAYYFYYYNSQTLLAIRSVFTRWQRFIYLFGIITSY